VSTLDKKDGGATMLRSIFRFIVGGVALAAFLAPLLATAQAVAAEDRPALEAQKEALFQQMFRDPANLDVTFAYADVSARLGDYEAAVSALERMLLFNPNLPRVQLELGALYFKMGSYELARDYFDKTAAANPPPEVLARVEQFRAEIEKGQSRHHLTGYVFTGIQYQSDANVAGASQLLTPTFFGPQLVLLNAPFTKQSSGSIFASSSLLYSYDLETQNRDTLEVTNINYLNHYFNSLVTRLDLSLLEVTGGPRLNFPNGGLVGDKLASFKPYVILDEVGLGWDQYFNAYGGGLEYDEIVWNDMPIKAVYEFRQKNYTNAPTRPLSRGLNGSDNLVSVQATKPISPNSAVTFQFDYLNQSTRLAYYSNRSYAITGAYRIRYDDPTGITSTTWETTPFVGRAWSYYDAPDPCCVTGPAGGISSQLTQRWRFGLTHTIALTSTVGIVLQAERDIISSNLPLYAYNNTTFLIGPQIRF
jgi:tetratricopeptide (TPR) repeat protein